MRNLFKFPNPVNEYSARFVAAGVLIMCILISIFGQMWVLIPLTYGFWARVLTGPTMSPLGQFVTRILVPKLGLKKFCPGPPKRFAQGIGTTLSTFAIMFWISGDDNVARAVVGLILLASALESIVGFCLGCAIFSYLMKFGIIPKSVCEACVIPDEKTPR